MYQVGELGLGINYRSGLTLGVPLALGLQLKVYRKAYGAGTRIRYLAKTLGLFEGLELTFKDKA